MIEGYAFYGCSSLKNIVISDSTTTIESYAFYDCISLESIDIPDSVTGMGTHCFSNCSSLESIDIPDSVTSMGTYCFSNCSSLVEAKLPNKRVNITEGTFQNCSSLKSIDIPGTVEKINTGAFEGCISLESVLFSEDSNLKTINSDAFLGCTSLKEFIAPETTEKIYSYAFRNCKGLEKVSLPQSLKTLESYAFMGCDLLSDLDIADYSITEIKTQTFKDCPALVNVTLPKGLKTIGTEAFMNCTGLTAITIPESVTSIDATALSYPTKTTIYGKTGSYAETFATENGFKFSNNNVPSIGISLLDGVENIILEQGETYRAVFEWLPENSNDVITLTADNTKVTFNGHDIYARYAGDTVVTATASSGVTYEFNVHIKKVSNIELASLPTKTSYLLGDKIDLTDMVVKVNYNDGTSKNVTDYTVEGFDSSVEGECTVTVKWVSVYGNTYSKTFKVTVVDPRPKLTGIYVATLPTKVNYERKEALDLTGMVVMGTYNNNTESAIASSDYTVSGYNALKNGAQTITVQCGNFTTMFNVFVGKVMSSVSIESLPSKISYAIGEELDTTGLSLLITYTDGTTELIASGFIIGEYDFSKSGQKTITVSYGGKTLSFNVTVACNHVWVIDKAVAATCTETGLTQGKHCSVCGTASVKQEVIPAQGHVIVIQKTVEATCTTDGNTEGRFCASCGEVYMVQETIPATGHTYKNGECTTCGLWQYKNTAVKLGTVKNTTSGVYITWSKLPGANKYAVYRKTTGGWTKLTASATGTSFTDKTAKNNVKYTYTVRAINGTEYNTTYNKTGLKITFMSAPKITSVTNAATGVTVKWGKVSGATVYYVYRKTTGGWTKLGSTKSTSFTDKKAKAGTKYTYTIIAAKSGAKSSYYGGKAIVRLTVPKLTKLTATTKKNTLTFGKVTGATSYIIYRKTNNGGWVKIATTKSTKYVDTKVKKGTYYTYTVKAVNGSYTSYYNTKGLKVKAK